MITTEKILNLSEELKDVIINDRRYFHQHPEKPLEEYNTADFVEKELEKLGIETIRVGETGIVGVINKNDTSGKTVGLRADMDALELDEKSGLPFASQTPGIMHACGHDGHTAMLLGAARVFKRIGFENLPGKIYLLFQPAEEKAMGAKMIVDSGKINDMKICYGQHLFNWLSTGQVMIKNGPVMAGARSFKITLNGRGGHGSEPQKCNNPIPAISNIISALYTIAVNTIPGYDRFVLSVNNVHSGTRMNIVPETGIIEGNLRFDNDDNCRLAEQKIQEIVQGIALSYGLQSEVEFEIFVPVTENDASVYNIFETSAKKVFGEANLKSDKFLMGSEDFAHYKSIAPSAFMFLGSGNKEKDCTQSNHSAYFKIDEDALVRGTAMYVQFACEYLFN